MMKQRSLGSSRPAKAENAPAAERTPIFSVTTKDLEIQTFTAGGPGGQHQNRSRTGIRIVHHASGARGESREHRSQAQNKRAALERLVQTHQFRYWVRERVNEIDGKESAEQWVERQLADIDNLKVEVKDAEGRWTTTIMEELSAE